MINKKLIYIIFLSFFYTQNVNFDYWESKWLRAGVSSKKQEDFRNDIKLELESIDDDKYVFILTQWLLRSHYSEGKIDDSNNLVALNEYNNTVKNYYKDFTAMIYHEPYEKEMKKCNANPNKDKSCICKSMTPKEISYNNLDFLSDNNIKENFGQLWILIGNSESSTIRSTKSFKKHEFITSPKKVKKNAELINAKTNVMFTKGDNSQNVRYSIMPKPYFFRDILQESENIIDKLNSLAKYGRFEQIRDKAWNVNQEVPRLNTWSDLDENNLDFKDPLVINNKQIKDSADPDKNIYGLKIAYFPVTEKDNRNRDIDRLIDDHKLYIFDDDSEQNPDRYTFAIEPNLGEELNLFDDNVSSNDNDYAIYLKWGNDWHLRRHIDDNQFTIEIPKYYTDNYDVFIQDFNFNTLLGKEYESGIKISSNIKEEDMQEFDEWKIDKNEYSYIGHKNTDKIFTNTIEVRKKQLPKNKQTLKIEIKEKENTDKNNNFKIVLYAGLGLLLTTLFGGN